MRAMWPYLPSKSALAPKQQLYNNINFIHISMISRVARPRCLLFSVIQKHREGNRETLRRRNSRVALTHAEGAQVGKVCWRPSDCSCEIFRRCVRETSPLPGSRVAPMCICVRVCGAGRTLPGRERTAPSLSSLLKFSKRTLQPTAPTAVRPYLPLFPIQSGQNTAVIQPAALVTFKVTPWPVQPRGRGSTCSAVQCVLCKCLN